jgi:hypothetical protein
MTSKSNGARAAVTVVRANAADIADQTAGLLSRWVERSRLDGSCAVEVVLGVALDQADACAMRQAAEAVVTDPINSRIRQWLAERPKNREFCELTALCRDYNGWATSSGMPRITEKMLSLRLKALGLEQRAHSRTRRSEFRLALDEGRDAL